MSHLPGGGEDINLEFARSFGRIENLHEIFIETYYYKSVVFSYAFNREHIDEDDWVSAAFNQFCQLINVQCVLGCLSKPKAARSVNGL